MFGRGIQQLLERHAAERAEWAQAAAEERRKLIDDAAAERAGLIQIIADLKGVPAPAAVGWPEQIPKLHKTEDDEIAAQRYEVAEAIQAELDARVAHDLGTPTQIPVQSG